MRKIFHLYINVNLVMGWSHEKHGHGHFSSLDIDLIIHVSWAMFSELTTCICL